MTTEHEEAAKRIAYAILDRSTEGTATRVALKQSIAGGGERDLGGLNAIALADVISEQLAALIAEVRQQAMEEAAGVCDRVAFDYDEQSAPHHMGGANTCAAAIRARLAPHEGKEEGK
jgi:hypothetical protein